ncbi:EF-P beta-lysylation protein EpmB [Rubripirellula sp.]|nr:EF-P beta-lysylation protein EpmB [Rubripirellula sp.]
MIRDESTDQSDEILARRGEFVPPALDGFAEEISLSAADWRVAMKVAIRSSSQLRSLLGLTPENSGNGGDHSREEPNLLLGEQDFPTFVPLEFLSRMRPGDPSDPLLRQVLPVSAEDLDSPGFTADPVGDLKMMPATGVLHKYEGRALLITTGACGVHCRYCFRREFPYTDASANGKSVESALAYLSEHEEIEEVLLSGGDPLTLVDERLQSIVDGIATHSHVKRLRVHTRMPIVIPQRVTSSLIKLFAETRLVTWFVVHVNHPRELDHHVLDHLGRLVDAGIPVLNQAVLLRGVNDSVEVLEELCEKLINHRIQPYYLHQLDRVRGASHFEVSLDRGLQIMQALRERLPGYAVPKYVVEQAGEKSKTPVV